MIDRQRFVGWVVLAASVCALLISAVTGLQSYQHAECQAQVNETLIRATSERAAAAAADRQSDRDESAATAELIRSVFTLRTTAERVAAYAEYRERIDAIDAQRAETERQRQAHPLPAPPSETCG